MTTYYAAQLGMSLSVVDCKASYLDSLKKNSLALADSDTPPSPSSLASDAKSSYGQGLPPTAELKCNNSEKLATEEQLLSEEVFALHTSALPKLDAMSAKPRANIVLTDKCAESVEQNCVLQH